MTDMTQEPQRFWAGDTVELVNSNPIITDEVVETYLDEENKRVYVLKCHDHPVGNKDIVIIVPGAERKALAWD